MNQAGGRPRLTAVDTVPISGFSVEDASLECGGADLGVVSRQQARELTQEKSMTVRRVALQAKMALDHKRRWKRASHHATKHYEGELHEGEPFLVLATGSECSKETNKCFLASWRGHQQHIGHSLDQVRPFHDDDEAAQEHVTEHTRKMRERLLQDGDFSYEDITGQDEHPVDSPPTCTR